MHSVFGKINYGGLKCNSLYLGLVLQSSGWQSLIERMPNIFPSIHTFLGGLQWSTANRNVVKSPHQFWLFKRVHTVFIFGIHWSKMLQSFGKKVPKYWKRKFTIVATVENVPQKDIFHNIVWSTMRWKVPKEYDATIERKGSLSFWLMNLVPKDYPYHLG